MNFFKLNLFKTAVGSPEIDERRILDSINGRTLSYLSISQLNYIADLISQQTGITIFKYINKGVFSAVYECGFNGKRYILKFTFDKEDFKTTSKFDDIKKSVLDKYKKYFQDIALKSSVTLTLAGARVDVFYILTEYLEPVKFDINQLFLVNENNFDDFIESEFYKTKIKDLKDFVKNDGDLYKRFDEIISFLEYLVSSNFTTYKNMSLMDVVSKLYSEVKNNFELTASEKDLRLMIHQFYLIHTDGDFKNNYIDNDRFNMDLFERLPESKDFAEFLNYLKDNFNILYNDLHSNNIMRRSNGDFVLSDVGLFDFDDFEG